MNSDAYFGLIAIERSLNTAEAPAVLARLWLRLANMTYGIVEKAAQVAVLPVDIGWNDVGNWAAVYDVLPHDGQGNAVVGKHVVQDTWNSLIYSPNRLVALLA